MCIYLWLDITVLLWCTEIGEERLLFRLRTSPGCRVGRWRASSPTGVGSETHALSRRPRCRVSRKPWAKWKVTPTRSSWVKPNYQSRSSTRLPRSVVIFTMFNNSTIWFLSPRPADCGSPHFIIVVFVYWHTENILINNYISFGNIWRWEKK